MPGDVSLTWNHVFAGALRVVATLWARLAEPHHPHLLRLSALHNRHRRAATRYWPCIATPVLALAIVFGLAAVGVNTGSLSWFFGAAGIGLAFGLQDVIGNFVSGLIMLIERPIRVGDIVQIGPSTGTVEDIRMRGTTRCVPSTTLR